jgi:DNA modification methylase
MNDEQSQTVPATFGSGLADRQIALRAISELKPHPRNARKHSKQQIQAIAKSIDAFGFNAPVLLDGDGNILAGHGRVEAAKLLGMTQVPVVLLGHLTETQAKAYMLADNKLTDRSTWDDETLAVQLKELSDLVPNFDIEATGFEAPEIDFRIQSLADPETFDQADDFQPASGPSVSRQGDLWHLGDHRIYCGSALDPDAYLGVMDGKKAAACFTDPPYNVRIDGNVANIGGKGSSSYREFAMGAGEMTGEEFTNFLSTSFKSICAHSAGGAVIYACMDWRHMEEILAAGRSCGCELLNLCVWVKGGGGMGSHYRSRHEFVFVFRNGREPHLNNIQLGRFGRNRTNIWNYQGVNAFANRQALKLHPTVKPIAMISDAILDSTRRGEIVLDPFLGSGTTILAAERTGRRCYGVELDPLYVDTTIQRWQRMTGRKAHNQFGESFEVVKSKLRTDR